MKLSIRAYARTRGVSDTAVHKAIRAGRITTEPDGSIDPVKADAQWANNTDPAKSHRSHRKKKKSHKLTQKKKVPKAAFDAVEDTLKAHPMMKAHLGDVSDIDSPDALYQKAKTAHEILKAQIGQLELRILKGELIDRQKALTQVFNAARAERDAWLNWPARICAQLAADLGVDEHALYVVLSASIRRHLQALSEGRA